MLRIGILSAAHVHTPSYVHCLKGRTDAQVVGVWDHDAERGQGFADQFGLPFLGNLDALLEACDAVVVTSENRRHLALVEAAARAGKHILCEKPVVTSEDDAVAIEKVIIETGVKFMTAFPCRYSPAFHRLRDRIRNGDIGEVQAICATNRGTCPFLWFVNPEESGGGAMIDHVVHVTDLLRALLGEEVVNVQAQIGSNVYGQTWDDTAMLTLEFASGIFATLDSSWSRPASFRTWGDVTLNVVGTKGVIELDMFGQDLQHYHPGGKSHSVVSYGSNLDQAMVDDFVHAVLTDGPVPVTLHDGLQAARVAIAGYRSASAGQPVLA
ncbi:MAG: Gfo/Idh/MocA family protein [Fimbriimonas sp.]